MLLGSCIVLLEDSRCGFRRRPVLDGGGTDQSFLASSSKVTAIDIANK